MKNKPEETLPIEEVDATQEAALKALFADSREAHDPGDHFFEAMQRDVMDQLDAPVKMQGGEVAPAQAPVPGVSWWRRVLDAAARRPTLAYAGVMLAVLAALVWWPAKEHTLDTLDPPPKTAAQLELEELLAHTKALADAKVVPASAVPAEAVLRGDVKVLVPHGLAPDELARLHALTREMPLDLQSEEDGWTGVESESQAFLDAALDELEDGDLEWWEEQYEERTL